MSVPPPEASLHIQAVFHDGSPVARVIYLLRYNGRFLPPAVLRVKAYQQEGTRGQPQPDGSLQLNLMPRGRYEIWPAMNERELSAIQAAPPPPAATVDAASGDYNVRFEIARRGN
jgi:hypothetical protein